MTNTQASGEATALSRELAEFLIDFSIALHTHAIYPAGHPLLGTSQERLVVRLRTLLLDRDTLSLGIARDQLVIEGVATDPGNPLLRELSQRLHKHHLGALKFFRGVEPEEVSSVLRTLAADATRMEQPIGLGPAEVLRSWANVRLYPLTFQHLELLDDSDETPGEEGVDDGSAVRAAQLWIGLARAAMASDVGNEEGSSGAPPPPTDPTAVAQAIDERSHEVAYDQVIVGYLLQIAEEIKAGRSTETTALQRRISRLVRSLKPDTLKHLLSMGGDVAQRQRFMLDATQSMSVDAVLGLVQAAAESSNKTMSESLVRMLNKLAAHADHGSAVVRTHADAALRDNVQRLVRGWSMEDPNPHAYRRALDGMARAHPLVPPAEGMSGGVVEAERMISMSLEVGVLGEATLAATDAMIARGQIHALLELVGAGKTPDGSVKEQLWDHIASPDQLRTLLQAPHLDIPLLERLTERMRVAAAEPLIDALESAKERTTRWKLIDLLTRLGADAAPVLLMRMDSAPWYLLRNILLLLGRLPAWPDGFTPAPYMSHPDARVRREAMKMLLKHAPSRDQAICSGLADADDGIVLLSLGAAAEGCPLPAAPLIMTRLDGPGLEPEVRGLAIRALSRFTRLPNTFRYLSRAAMAGTSLFGRVKLAPKSPEMLAAIAGLAAHWRDDGRAAKLLAAAAKSKDAEIRAAAAGREASR